MKHTRLLSRRPILGYSLIELMVVVSITSLLAALGAPSLKSYTDAQRMRSVSYDMVSDLLLARSEALKRGATVQVVPAGGSWVGGWRVLLASGQQQISQRNTVGGGVQVTSAPASVSFDLNGRVISNGAVVRFALSDGGQRRRCISLDPSGRPRSTTQECPV